MGTEDNSHPGQSFFSVLAVARGGARGQRNIYKSRRVGKGGETGGHFSLDQRSKKVN